MEFTRTLTVDGFFLLEHSGRRWTEFRGWHVVAKRLSPTLQTTIMGLSRDEILEQFEEFRKQMDEQNDKRERLIKASQATPFSPEADVSD